MDFLKSVHMKKIVLLFLLFISAADKLQAQTFAEWFDQKNTQTKYLIQQIAAFQVYIGYLKKGYNIAKGGLNTISGFTRGELNLHTEYFNSLKAVNPKIRRYTKVAGIIALQVRIVQDYNRTYRRLSGSDTFDNEELDYIGRVFSRLLDDCAKTLDELMIITTDGKLEMKDDERMERIDKLYSDMQDKFTFLQSFSNDAKSLASARLREKSDIQNSRTLQGIKN